MRGTNLQTGEPVYAKAIGYLQYIDIPALQKIAEDFDLKINIISLPGEFITPDQPIAYIEQSNNNDINLAVVDILNAFTIDDDRVFDEDPRFGLIILSEIGRRALSSAVNDPGTAIDIIESFIRLFSIWVDGEINKKQDNLVADRVFVPEISLKDVFDDAFNPISRDGAGTVEVTLWLQKAFRTLVSYNNKEMNKEAVAHANLAYRYAKETLILPEELEALKEAHKFTTTE